LLFLKANQALAVEKSCCASNSKSDFEGNTMNRTTQKITASVVLMSAAFSGMLAGCKSGTSASGGTPAVSDDLDKHSCKGQNACKGHGGCKTGDKGCKGQNSCKGNGGCKTLAT
jgi:hypothetical protein